MKRITPVLIAVVVADLALFWGGCASKDATFPDQPTVSIRPPTTQEVEAWRHLLKVDVAVVKAVILVQPEGPERERWLKLVNAVQTYGELAELVAELTAGGIETKP